MVSLPKVSNKMAIYFISCHFSQPSTQTLWLFCNIEPLEILVGSFIDYKQVNELVFWCACWHIYGLSLLGFLIERKGDVVDRIEERALYEKSQHALELNTLSALIADFFITKRMICQAFSLLLRISPFSKTYYYNAKPFILT